MNKPLKLFVKLTMFLATLFVWVVLLPLFSGITTYFVYGYLMSNTITGKHIELLHVLSSGIMMMLLWGWFYFPLIPIMSLAFLGVAILCQKRFLSVQSFFKVHISIVFAVIGGGIGLFFSADWPSPWQYISRLSFFVWIFLLSRGLLGLFSTLMPTEY